MFDAQQDLERLLGKLVDPTAIAKHNKDYKTQCIDAVKRSAIELGHLWSLNIMPSYLKDTGQRLLGVHMLDHKQVKHRKWEVGECTKLGEIYKGLDGIH